MSLDAKPQGGSNFKFRAATVGHMGVSGIRLISRRTPTGPGASEYSAIYRHEGTAIAGLVSESWLSRIRTAAFGAAVFEHLVNPGPLAVANGLGVREGAYVFFFGSAGLATGQAIAASLLFALLPTAVSLVGGILFATRR